MGAFGEFTYATDNRLFVGKPIEDIKAAKTALDAAYTDASDKNDALEILLLKIVLKL